MKSFFEEFSGIIGLVLLVFMIIILFSTPSMLLANPVTIIDTELSHASGDAPLVRTKMDFGNNEHVRAFPKQIGDWKGSDYDTARVAKSLGADVMLIRAYTHSESYLTIVFCILQSDNRSSFHPPIVCYPALGYTIEEEGKAGIPVRNLSWIEEPLFAVPATKRSSSNLTLTIPVKKLVVVKVKESDEHGNKKVTERNVVLYFYVRENPISSDTFTMIRVSALAPTEGSYDTALNEIENFMGDTIPYMFEFRQGGDIIAVRLAKSGLVGWSVIAVLFALPFLIIIYPRIKIK